MNAGMTILLTLCLTAHLLVGDAVDYDNDDLLAILLDLHKSHCGDAAMCHVTNGSHVEPSVAMFPRPCCVPCSCLSTCDDHQYCCPSKQNLRKATDFVTPSGSENQAVLTTESHRLENAFNTSTIPQRRDGRELSGRNAPQSNPRKSKNGNAPQSNPRNSENDAESFETNRSLGENLPDTTESMQKTKMPAATVKRHHEQTSQFKTDDIDNDFENNAVIHGVETVCIRPQLFYKPNSHPDSVAYKMVVSCPAEFKDAIVVEKCRTGQDNENVADVIPITSKRSGLTYVNKYCLFCNEQEQQPTPSVDEWQIQLIDDNKYYRHRIVPHPQSLMTWVDHHFFNVHFVPKNPSSIDKCNPYDVTSCNQTGFWENYDEAIEMVCRVGEDLPITHFVNGNGLLFKNIACVHCNVPSGFNNSQLFCGYTPNFQEHSSRQTLTVNFHSFVGYQTSDKEDISATYIETSVLKNLKSGSCPQGFLVILGRCRRIVCPRDHYIEIDRCVPLYDRLTGLDINFKLKLTPAQNVQVNRAKQVVEGLKSVVNNTLDNLVSLQPREVSVWFLPTGNKGNRKVVDYYLFDIFLYSASNEVQYNQAVKEMHTFFNSIKSLNTVHVLEGNKLEFKYDIGHGVELTRLGMIDLAAGGKRLSLMGDDFKLEPKISHMTLSDINWCIRTEFVSVETERPGRNVYSVTQTNKFLFEDQFDIERYPGSFSLYTCISYFVDDTDTENRYPELQNDIPNTVEDSEDADDNHSLTFDKGFAAAVAGLVLVIIGVILYKARSTFRKRQLRAEDQSHVAIEMSNVSFRSSANDPDCMSEIPSKSTVLDDAKIEENPTRDNGRKNKL